MNKKRLACVHIPGVLIEVCLRDNPALERQPLAIVSNDRDSAPIVAVNDRAAQAGVSTAVTAAQGHTLCPNLIIKIQDGDRENEESGKILKKLQSIGPFIEEASTGTYFLEASGLTLLHGSEKGLAKKILEAVTSCGYPVKVGLAANKFVAWTAADVSDVNQYTIVPPGKESTFLDPLPIEHLRLSAGATEKLRDLGLKTIGQLAAFSSNEMARRFAEEGIALSRLARGEDPDFFLPELPTADLSENLVLDYPAFTAAGVIAHVEKVLNKLLGNLRRSGRGCRHLVVIFHLEDKSEQSLPIAVESPTASVSAFIRQLRRTLEKPLFPSGITDITVMVPATSPLVSEQLEFHRRVAGSGGTPCDSGNLSETANHPRLYAAHLRPGQLPEKGFQLALLSCLHKKARHKPADGRDRKPVPNSGAWCHPYARHCISGLRLFQPPREVRVTARNGKLHRMRLKRQVQAVVRQSGPWELSGDWWSADFDRLYYEVETGERQTYLLFFDRLSSRWFVQGIFD